MTGLPLTCDLTYPFRVPDEYERGESALFRPAPGHYLSDLFLRSTPAKDRSPIDADGLHPGLSPGFFSLRDFWTPDDPCQVQIDLEFTLPAVPDTSAGEFALVASYGSTDHVSSPVPFMLTVYGDRLRITSGTVFWESLAGTVEAGRWRVTAQRSLDRLRVWKVTDTGSEKLCDIPAPLLTWAWECDLTIGRAPFRFPWGAPVGLDAPPGIVFHRAQVAGLCLDYSSTPPLGVAVADHQLGTWTDFSGADGCFFRGTVVGNPAVLRWFENTNDDVGSFKAGNFNLSGLSADGTGRAARGFCASGQHEWRLSDVRAGSFVRAGVVLLDQCYSGVARQVHCNGSGVGLAVLNNSALVTLDAAHGGEGNKYGVLACDSPALLMSGGWAANNSVCNVYVGGDSSSLVWNGGGAGFESSVSPHNVRLVGVASVVLNGTVLNPTPSPIPAVEMDRCFGGSFGEVQFGLNAMSPGAIRLTGHRGPAPAVREALRLAGGAVPLFCPDNT